MIRTKIIFINPPYGLLDQKILLYNRLYSGILKFEFYESWFSEDIERIIKEVVIANIEDFGVELNFTDEFSVFDIYDIQWIFLRNDEDTVIQSLIFEVANKDRIEILIEGWEFHIGESTVPDGFSGFFIYGIEMQRVVTEDDFIFIQKVKVNDFRSELFFPEGMEVVFFIGYYFIQSNEVEIIEIEEGFHGDVEIELWRPFFFKFDSFSIFENFFNIYFQIKGDFFEIDVFKALLNEEFAFFYIHFDFVIFKESVVDREQDNQNKQSHGNRIFFQAVLLTIN